MTKLPPLIVRIRQEQLEAVQILREYDHAFISEEGVNHFLTPFGLQGKGWAYIQKATPSEPKGLTFHDGARQHKGLGADELAERLCKHLKVEYRPMFGRGSRLRECCDALERHLGGGK